MPPTFSSPVHAAPIKPRWPADHPPAFPITITVLGVPKPGGSKRAFYVKSLNRAVLTDASGKAGKDWRGDCKSAAILAFRADPLDQPLKVTFDFTMPRPQSHYRSNGELKPTAPKYHTSAPDTTKLIRSIEDACTKILWKDDSRIAVQNGSKLYGERPGCTITIEAAP